MLVGQLAIPKTAEGLGFSANETGGHMARSMMLDEITIVLASTPIGAEVHNLKRAVVDENLLGKPTFSSRQKSFRHLSELYGLDPSVALFRTLRTMAATEPAALPLMAMTCAFCRDAQLRQSFELLEDLRVGETLSRQRMEAHLEAGFPRRFSEAMKKSLAQNVNTTWTHAGHLVGRSVKRRALPTSRVAASVYAMFAGYLLGLRGDTLVQSVFGRLVASDPSTVIGHLASAQARAWLRFRHGGGVTEIDFAPLLTIHDRELSGGTT